MDQGEGNYSIIYTLDQKYVLKRSLRKVMDDLPNYFIQAQKAYLVNQHHIESIKGSTLEINQQLIPIGRNYRKQLLESIVSIY
ncbi:hypothetical protein GO730_35175 [Spirosoma sp. HMF3257]|uniref:HTH LytTR-type domain-containing protein n=1 Tax=Spirosoma telluris TaxID=2183553 RepID=A0A327NUA4_9BACT|nr:hypothetical protein [Spirosoma telluris]RAI78019.1 hypothetical protein HMF3257_35075 [Spirosoma telluris]